MYITGIDPSKWSTTQANALGAIGVNITDQGAKQYKYVKLLNETATVAADDGDMVAYLAAPANDAEVNTVVADFSDADTKPVGAGVLESDANGNFDLDGVSVASIAGTTGTAYYGWVQQTGYRVMNQALGGIVAAGDSLLCSATDKALTLATAVDDPVCAYAIVDATKNVRLACV